MNGDFQYSSREELIRALNRPTCDGDSLHQPLAHSLQGDVLWSLVRVTMLIDTPERSAGLSATFIFCDLLLQSAGMWGNQSFIEANELRHFDCPLDYLERTHAMSTLWRTRVRLYHLAQGAQS
ncbi:MAG: hypothetical protein ACRCWW_08645 [Scandinavium sp.]|uniref:hypothetical protein n=1 Tax=Scandinavium sp. TaxID=2830653 RepID=UPI003F2C3718